MNTAMTATTSVWPWVSLALLATSGVSAFVVSPRISATGISNTGSRGAQRLNIRGPQLQEQPMRRSVHVGLRAGSGDFKLDYFWLRCGLAALTHKCQDFFISCLDDVLQSLSVLNTFSERSSSPSTRTFFEIMCRDGGFCTGLSQIRNRERKQASRA